MNKASYILFILTAINFTACGQVKTKEQTTNTTIKTNKMDTSKLTNSIVKSAFDAWQNGDSKTFLSYFISDAKLYDDGNPRDFQKFVKEACGHEIFTTIDKVEKNGLDINGQFHTESWGDFKTYFKFHINTENKITRLDIGQAN